jgi:hypothetical protein
LPESPTAGQARAAIGLSLFRQARLCSAAAMMRRLFLPWFLAAFVVVLAAPSRADEATHRQAVMDLMELLRAREMILQSAQTAYEPHLRALGTRGVPAPAIDEMRVALAGLVKKIADGTEMIDGMVSVYMRTFSEPEIRELLTFYKSPVGQKTIAQLPKVMQEGAQIGQQAFAKHQDEFGEIVQAIMKKHQVTLQPGDKPAEKP